MTMTKEMIMALTPKTSTAPAFESDESAAVSDTPAPISAAPQPQASLPAVAPANPVSTAVRAKFGPALEEFKDLISLDSVEFNTFTRVTVGLDGFSDDQKKDLGKMIKLQLMSYSDTYTLSPGVQDPDATQHVRFSNDGKTVNGTGQSCAEYIEQLRTVEGYKDASMKHYLVIYGQLIEANGKEIPAEDRQIIAMQVPPQSRAMFTRLQLEMGIKIAQGVAQATDVLVCRQEKRDGSVKYAVISFGTK